MPANTSRSAAQVAVSVLLVLLVSGCGGKKATSTAASTPSTATVGPTTTTMPPLTAEEVAWLDAVDKLPDKMDKAFNEIPPNLTTSALNTAASKLRTCSRELRRIGVPSDRLQPVYVLAKKACAEYEKGARCFTAAARIGIPLADSPESRAMDRAIQCGFAVQGKGGELLADALNKRFEIEAATR
jgi:hypothetical protein